MVLKGKLKWFNKSLTSTIEGLGEEVEISSKRTFHIMHIPNPSSQPQSKIPLTFLFDQLYYNNVSSDALFHGSHLDMHNERCAVQNQRHVTLRNVTGRVGSAMAFKHSSELPFFNSTNWINTVFICW